jgi:3-oxo-5-alpha-steroid 4-dehydrogenase 1
MDERIFFNRLIIAWIILAFFIFIVLIFINAPYGRHTRKGWGLTIDSRIAWILMESISPIGFAVCFALGNNTRTIPLVLFLCMWEAHYIHRAFIYPFSLNSIVKRMPVLIIVFALIFNTGNTYLNGRYLFTFAPTYTNEWLTDPRFIAGVMLFITGFIINRRADHILRSLRAPGEQDYKIPYGELYQWVSCPNYLGEILIWVGWAIATWSLPGVAFAAWTIANLAPRARAHHRWYKEHFPGYPPERKALLPGIW